MVVPGAEDPIFDRTRYSQSRWIAPTTFLLIPTIFIVSLFLKTLAFDGFELGTWGRRV